MSTETNTLSPVKPNFLILDGLRGIAAVYVVFNHCRGNLLIGGSKYSSIVPVEQWGIVTKIYYSALQLTSLGREFVIFFFVLSGFSIAHSLTRNPGIAGFYKRRLIRLYPPYLLALIYAGVVFFLLKEFAPSQMKGSDMKPVYYDIEYIISNLFYIPKGDLISQFWSLTHEVIFYLLIAFLFTRRLKYYMIFSVIGYVIGCFVNYKDVSGTNIPTAFLFDYNIFFAIGIFLYQHFGRISKMLQLSKTWFWTGSIVLLGGMISTKFMLGEYNRVTLLIAAALSVFMVVNFLYHKIDNFLLRWLGAMSYSIYITHVASMYLFIVILDKLGFPYHSDITQWWVWLSGVLFCIFMTVPAYYLAEYPTKKILSRMRAR